MGQTESCTAAVSQMVTQTQYNKQTTDQSDGKTDFQSLMEEKSQTVTENTGKGTAKSTKTTPTAKQSSDNKQEADPIVQQMACAELMAADNVVVLTELPEAEVPVDVAPIVTAAATEELTATQEPAAQTQVQVETPEVVKDTKVDTKSEQPRDLTVQPEEKAEAEPAVSFQSVPTTQQTQEDDTQPQQQKAEENFTPDEKQDEPTVNVSGGELAQTQPIFRNVEANMVKVGEATPARESQPGEDVEQQVVKQVTESLSQGETKVEIQLSPSSLGKVTVEMTQQKDGTLHIALSAENTHTKALLEQHTGNLQTLVSNQTQKPVQVEVSQRQDSQHNLQDNGQNGQSGYQQQERRQQKQNSEDFLQKLRLGLLPLDVEAVS